MEHRDYFTTLARHNAWANQRLITGLGVIDDASWHADQGLFFGSIHATFNHILVAEMVWIGRFIGRPSGISGLAQSQADQRQTLGELLATQNEVTRSVMATLPDPLPARFAYHTMAGEAMDMPFAPLLGHLFNHATHHRGQITAAAHRLGHRIEELDLPYFMRDLAL